MTGTSTKPLRLIVAALLLGSPAAPAAGILPDADFAGAAPKANVDDGWRWDGIAGNIQVYLDGSRTPEANRPWTGGSLPGNRSIRNDVPLRIAGGLPFMAGDHPFFTGTIGFVEAWHGQGLLDGMTPVQYGNFRWSGGKPKRGLITDKR